MVNFAWPWIFLLVPLPWLLQRRHGTGDAGSGYAVPPALAAALARSRGASGGGLQWIVRWAAWAALLTAIAQPSIVSGEAIEPASGRALVIALDLSSSMERKDFVLDGSPVDRLTALKAVAADFVEKRAGDRIGLVLFGEGAMSAAPISYDLSAIANAIRESDIGMVGRTTAIGEAIGLSILKLREDPAPEKTVVLLSDGTNNAGSAEPEDAARLAAKLSIRIHAIGMGSAAEDAAGSPIHPSADLDEATLERVAHETGGRFFRARTTDELARIYAEIDEIETSEAEAPPIVPRTDLRNAVLAVLALLLVALALGERRGRAA